MDPQVGDLEAIDVASSGVRAGGDGVPLLPAKGMDNGHVASREAGDDAEADDRNKESDPEKVPPNNGGCDLVREDGVVDGSGSEGNAKMAEEGRRKESPQTKDWQSNRLDGARISGVETQTKSCCDKEGHICFDCFPIPDQLLTQLHRQTGMSKLKCLQAVQTVVKFYKKDLVCSKYFVNESSEDTFSEYSQTEEGEIADDSVLVFKETPVPVPIRPPPVRHQRMRQLKPREGNPEVKQYFTKSKKFQFIEDNLHSEPEFKFEPGPAARPALKLCGADKFRHLVRHLKLESLDKGWADPRNVSSVFTFFRKLNKVVAALDKPLLKKLVLEDDYEFIWMAANLLRKESRWSIQWELLGILGTIAARDSQSRKLLLDSEFPIYLSRVLLDPATDSPRIGGFAELLTIMFIGGKQLPVYLMEHFGLNFVLSILDTIENDDSRPGWALPDVLVKLLLAYNLQFSSGDVYNNLTILGIARIGVCKTTTSRLIDWLDQKDAPLTGSWDVNVSVHQCVTKLVQDIFLCRTTSHVFSVAQSVMLMRLLTKSLSNFMAGDKRRTSYLQLIQTILRHCKYDYIRNTPCLDYLEEILCEKSKLSLQDQGVIRSIFKEFPQLKQEGYNYYFL